MKRARVAIGLIALSGLGAVGLMEVAAGPLHVSKTRAQRSAKHNIEPATDAPLFNPLEAQGGGIGPDVIVGALHNASSYTTGGAVNGIRAYSVGTTSCNVGTENLSWIAETNQHPVIGQSLYRMKDGKFEQIGQSWLKHGFFALWESLCAPCENGSFIVCGGDCLIVGCSDPYDSSLNGDNTGAGLGPKSQVNASTGFFNFPHGASNCGTGAICQRLQVHEEDIETYNSGTTAVYFVEGQYVTPDDAAAGNQNNNASYRRAWFNPNTNLRVTNPLGGTNPTIQQVPAITAWAAADPTVSLQIVDIPGDGRIYVASKATDLGGGLWNYEIAVHNLNSHRSIGSVAIPVGSATNVTNIGFHDVDYHSGEPYDGTDWPGAHVSDTLSWATTPYATNENANAIRWGTLYNFRFVANAPPIDGQLTLGLFRPPSVAGAPNSVIVTAKIPEFMQPCLTDIVSSDTFQPPPDGVVDGADLAQLLGWWGNHPESPFDVVDNSTFQPPPDGVVDGADLATLLGEWGPCN